MPEGGQKLLELGGVIRYFFQGGFPPWKKNLPDLCITKKMYLSTKKKLVGPKIVSSSFTCKKLLIFFAICLQKCLAIQMTVPAAAGEKFFELASQYVPKMALLSSIFIEKSIHKDYAGGSWQKFLLSNSLIYSKNACFWRRYSIKYSQYSKVLCRR